MIDGPDRGGAGGADRLRHLRREFESAVLARATSLDGRRFRFEAPPTLGVQVGGYVRVLADSGPVLGQVLALDLARREGPEVDLGGVRTPLGVQVAEGAGALLSPAEAFHDAPLVPAGSGELAAVVASPSGRASRLPVGEMVAAPGVPVALDAAGFARHTFMCGQSGSGKSYALGRIIEQLVAHTRLPIVILDPNSDCVNLAEPRADAPPELAAAWREVAGARVRVHRAGPAGPGHHPLRLRFFSLDPRTRAAVLGLDPLADREEYGAFLTAVDRESQGVPPDQILREVAASTDPDMHRLHLRMRNLGVLSWSTWWRDDPGLLVELDRDEPLCTVVDLGGVDRQGEREMIAAATLGHLWEHRARRRPVLVVIDEAHNVCPQQPASPLQRLTTELAVAIAGEGRKYGIYLFIASQRPQKVHDNVLSQCDNLVLMRMASEGDLDHLTHRVTCAPVTLAARATTFGLGEALLAGRIIGHPTLARIGGRISREGGADVPAGWASRVTPA